jgi:hypothetical protein
VLHRDLIANNEADLDHCKETSHDDRQHECQLDRGLPPLRTGPPDRGQSTVSHYEPRILPMTVSNSFVIA